MGANESPPGVSIIVAVRNMESTIGRCVESLLALDYPSKEIIIVDDESTDSTPEVLSCYPVRTLRIKNEGVSGARNEGVRLASHEYIAFTDADCYVDRDWLSRLVKRFDDPKVGAVGGYVDFEKRGIIASAISIEYARRFNKRGNETRSVACISAAFRKTALQTVGGFRKLGGQLVGGEDIDLSYRIIEAGWRLVYEPTAVVHHGGDEMARGMVRRNFRNAVVSVVIYRNHDAAREDRFFDSRLTLQPIVFGASMAALLGALAIHWPYWLVFLAPPLLWNLSLAWETARETSRPLSILVVPPVFFARSAIFFVGALWGVVESRLADMA